MLAVARQDLFDAVLAGLGQSGVMTRAKLDLVRTRQLTRTYNPVVPPRVCVAPRARCAPTSNAACPVHGAIVGIPRDFFVRLRAGRKPMKEVDHRVPLSR